MVAVIFLEIVRKQCEDCVVIQLALDKVSEPPAQLYSLAVHSGMPNVPTFKPVTF